MTDTSGGLCPMTLSLWNYLFAMFNTSQGADYRYVFFFIDLSTECC